jgi:hypothetical protein
MITCQFYFIVAHGGGIEYKNDCRIVRCLLVAGSFLIEKKWKYISEKSEPPTQFSHPSNQKILIRRFTPSPETNRP